jgi:hypothetical protein
VNGDTVRGMTEPTVVATELEEVAPDVFHWRVVNDHIGGEWSSSHAVRALAGSVLIDPVQLSDDGLRRREPVREIVLTAATHQRSAWRYRQRFQARVWLPHGSRATEEVPDAWYGEDDLLPGGLRAIRTPGPEEPHYSLLREEEPRPVLPGSRGAEPKRGARLRPRAVPRRPRRDAPERRALRRPRLRAPGLAHGPPLREGSRAFRELLERTA